MASKRQPAPLIVIVGPTASGKSALALQIARRYNGEIICADSRTIYRGMDIGTAKPSQEERAEVPHYLLDVITPNERFSAARFKKLANKVAEDISSRGKIPLLVGGTGLYIDAVLYDYGFSNPDAERDPINPRHLKSSEQNAPKKLRDNTLIIGLSVDSEVLKERINTRVNTMIQDGFVDEARTLASKFGWEAPGLLAPGYKAFRGYLDGTLSLEEAKTQFVQNDLKLAKRQRSWFKRNKSIRWLSTPEEAYAKAEQFLTKQASN